MARPATTRQVAFAEAISRKLKVSLPAVTTRQSMYLFINAHIEAYHNAVGEEKERKMMAVQAWARFGGNHVCVDAVPGGDYLPDSPVDPGNAVDDCTMDVDYTPEGECLWDEGGDL